jgi:hypothetical protein
MEEKRRGRPKSKVKLHKRTVSFPPTLYDRLMEIADREERTVNELIVAVLRDFVRKDEIDKGNSTPALFAA